MSGIRVPRPFYGIYIVAACFVTLFFLWGMVLNTFPIFLKPITEDMNWGRGALTVGVLIASLSSIPLFPVAGRIADRLGAKPIMLAGAFLVGMGLIVGSLSRELWHMYIAFFLIGCGIPCGTLIPCSFVISNWFSARRGMAMGIAFSGIALGGMVMAPVANWIMLRYNWRTAWFVAGLEIFLLVSPVVFFVIRSRPSEMGLKPYRSPGATDDPDGEVWGVGVKEAFGIRAFWEIAGIFLILGIVTGGVNYHCVAYLTDIGHVQTKATYAWSIAMGVMVPGQLLCGPLADRWSARNAMAATCALFLISVAVLMAAESYPIAIAFAALYGFALGGGFVLGPLLTTEHLGLKNFGAIYGILNVMGTIGGGAIGPIVPGIYFDIHRTYLPVFYAFLFLMIVGVALSVLIRPARRLSGPVS